MKKIFIAMVASMGFLFVACSGSSNESHTHDDGTEMHDQKEGDNDEGHSHDDDSHDGHDH